MRLRDKIVKYNDKIWIVGTQRFIDFIESCLLVLETYDPKGYRLVEKHIRLITKSREPGGNPYFRAGECILSNEWSYKEQYIVFTCQTLVHEAQHGADWPFRGGTAKNEVKPIHEGMRCLKQLRKQKAFREYADILSNYLDTDESWDTRWYEWRPKPCKKCQQFY